MNDVTLGPGSLAGKGVYAARDFAAGEVVVAYELRRLGAADYYALPAGDDLFVHSFGGQRYLYPAPARFVNHSDDPSCYQDFDRSCDIALRPIARGEPVTIDANAETAHELSTFLGAYDYALKQRSVRDLTALISEEAALWLDNEVTRGGDAVVAALLRAGLNSLSQVEWIIGTGRWEAVSSMRAGTNPGPRHLTVLLKVLAGNWQIIYQHAG
ncbi:SET domain-containing protein [Actinoplanes sp. LDG1-06]|uniref:SET domain-containing protein n=1 Tax=Paractinoplanes ovalisporus TaxID=2810368 RepID=A0ABS2ATL3_9ACTN|nr:SET domain-containing protein [Actinoplanes ovalisporus]MBM2623156.1 SET domain-containing protein [Actinoplanes ovalisporus]